VWQIFLMPMICEALFLNNPTMGVGSAVSQGRGAAPRLAAALAVADVLGTGRSLEVALARRSAGLGDPRDRALAQEMAYGVLRTLPRLRDQSAGVMQRPLKARDLDVECLLWVGLYQLDALRVPAYAAVSQTVAAVRELGKPWASGLLNAVLRKAQHRYAEQAPPQAGASVEQHCFPDWLAARLRHAWPEDAEAVMQESNRHPPMTLRVNLTRLSRHAYAERLAAIGLTAHPLEYAPAALILDQPVDVSALPGFAEGWVSVQDGAAQLATPLLAAQAGSQVLDACAAPGGKTAHILEYWPDVAVTAVDVSAERLLPLQEGLTRLGLTARVLAADLAAKDAAPEPWADRAYDSILLDVPCSATGVIRRHPDIKWLRRPTDIAQLATTQGRLLDRIWPHLRPGGVLVYVTCSLLPEENHQQIQSFLQRTPDAREGVLEVNWGCACAVGRQVLPGDDGMDGFYFARLTRLKGVAPQQGTTAQ
jgi:16S rRNA (cytosine967-C5)-methyltransferase